MIIEKNGKTYTVTESRDKWKVSADSGKLALSVDVPKEICKTTDDLRNYIMNNNLF